MATPTRRRLLAGALSMLVPGAGQLYAGARRRGLVLLGISAGLALALAALVLWRRGAFYSLDRRLLVTVLAVDLGVLGFRLYAIGDAMQWRRARPSALVAIAALAALTVAPHVAAGYAAVRSYGVLTTVFAEEEPHDVLPARGVFVTPPKPRPVLPPSRPLESSSRVLAGLEPATERPWTTILLAGTDEGPGNWGARTDTMILVAFQQGTGVAAAFGIPRNLVEVPLTGVAGEAIPRFREPLNALYGFARSRPELFPGGDDPGATALKQTISRLLGLRVDYYALVNLLGFADLVDALGGVRIAVRERLVDEVTRPAWGEPKPRIDVLPGHTYRMGGRMALAYVRSRKDSDDYTRMARQRCFLGAMAEQLDPLRVLRSFDRLARTVEHTVRTDVPLDRLVPLARLVAGVDSGKLLTQTFGREYIARRRKSDNFPVADGPKIRATVRAAILHPERTVAAGGVAVARSTC